MCTIFGQKHSEWIIGCYVLYFCTLQKALNDAFTKKKKKEV